MPKSRPGEWVGYEDDFQKAAIASVRRILRAHRLDPRLAWHPPNGGLRHPSVAKKLKAMGTVSGYPDIIVQVPCAPHVALGIELKVRGMGRVSEAQRELHEVLERQGWRIEVCYGCPQVDAVVEDYLAQ